jgi:hypothetical protein
MNKIEKLINELSLDGVEFKELGGGIMQRNKGTKITAFQIKKLNKNNGIIKNFAGRNTHAPVNFGDIPKKNIHEKPTTMVKQLNAKTLFSSLLVVFLFLF